MNTSRITHNTRESTRVRTHDNNIANAHKRSEEYNMARIDKKTCTKCGGTFEVTEFYRDKSQKDGRTCWCKACEGAYNKAYNASLKKVEATKKAAITDDKLLAKFESGMKSERVKRGHLNASRDGTRTNASKARTSARRNATKAKANARRGK